MFLLWCVAFASTAFAGEISPGLDPAPRINPLVPSIDDPTTLTPADRLQRRIESLVRERDQRIRELLLQREGLRPATGAPSDPNLAPPLRERDQAHKDLQRALEEYHERTVSRQQDVLDATLPLAQALQRSTLAATNQLRIAECYHDLTAADTVDPADLTAGIKALDMIEIADLNEGDPVRYLYLRAWFLIAQARLTKGEERVKQIASATAAVNRLAQDHPRSELVSTARSLLGALQLPKTTVAP
jgi:hypothetical protein